MSSRYPILDNRPIDQWKVTELKEELKRRKLITRGLKEDLIKRLDESIRSDIEEANAASDNGLDTAPDAENLSEQEKTDEQEKVEGYDSEKAKNTIDMNDDTNEKPNLDAELQDTSEQVTTDSNVSNTVQGTTTNGENANAPETEVSDTVQDTTTDGETANATYALVSVTVQGTTAHGENANAKVEVDAPKVDMNDTSGLVDEGKIRELEIKDGTDSAALETDQVIQVSVKVKTETLTKNAESMVSLSGEVLQNKSDNLETELETDDLKTVLENTDSKPLHTEDKVNENQVSEVNPVLGFEVKSDSISTETVSINEKNELKDNIIADDVKLELDVKPEMVQPSSSDDVPDGGKSHPMDVEEPQTNEVSVEETGGNNAEIVDDKKKSDTGDLGSEKLNLDRSSGDDFMDEDVTDGKQIVSKSTSDEVGVKLENEAPPTEESHVDIVGDDIPSETNVSIVDEKNGPAASSVKRKLNDQQAVGSNDISKRQRRWNSEGLKVSEPQSGEVLSTTPKEPFQPAFRRSFSRPDSNVSEEAPKERVVPPSSKPPTNSLRIDRFLRPFTLKAVQELLGKTGTVTDFWMDHIKTHCYVSYSAVEEAVETRTAIYNLQWPANGGRQLIAEFVDPQEVKARLEPPAAPASSGAGVPPAPQTMQPPQPSPRQTVQKQQIPPPPPVSNPPTTPRDHHPAPVRERLTLPPPPPPPEKIDPPIMTLDDLFRKTKATPRIYFLPLSDEQVAAKLQAQGNTTIKLYAGLACRMMFLLWWCRRSLFDDGFVFSLRIYGVETELILNYPLYGFFFFLSGGTSLWVYSIKLEKHVLYLTFRTRLLEL